MNDFPMYVGNCNLYADDTMLDATGKTIDEVTDSLQLEINKLSLTLWFKHNHLTTNATKSCTMLIGSRQRIKDYVNRPNLGLNLDGDVIRNQTNCRYLGVDILIIIIIIIIINLFKQSSTISNLILFYIVALIYK